MAVRYLKIVLLVFIALLCLMYAGQNLANLDAAYQAVAYVLRMDDHSVYPAAFGPAIHSPALAWLALAMIIATEAGAGIVTAKGCWDLWAARSTPAAIFNARKSWALLGCGLGLVVWLGFFSVIGGAYFQMWQTQAGALSLQGAFQYLAICAFVLLFVNSADT